MSVAGRYRFQESGEDSAEYFLTLDSYEGEIAEAWRPYRSVAARILWQYYRTLKGREVAP